MPVYSQHPNYTLALPKWQLVRDIVNNNANHRIRTVDLNDKVRSQQYKEDAILTNFTALTKYGLTGLILREDPEYTLPTSLQHLEEDATGTGLTLDQLTQKIIGDLLETGRFGLLADYPPNPGNLSLAEQELGNYKPRILPYNAEAILNWGFTTINNRTVLNLLVLAEDILVLSEDGFEWTKSFQYRVLRLTDGVYNVSLYQADPNDDSKVIMLYENYIPRQGDGSAWPYIPFTMIGSENNDFYVDNPPLYDLAVLNFGHLKNSADYEESVFVTGQPTVVMNVGDMDPLQWKELNNGGFKYGSRGGHVVGAGGNAQLLQANPNQLAAEAMKMKESQAVSIGARFITPAGGRETAEAARIRFSSQNSALYLLTKNISSGMEAVLNDCYKMTSQTEQNPTIEFDLNDQFYEEGADPTLIAQAIMMFDRNAVTRDELRSYAGEAMDGLIDDSTTTAELQLEAELQDPLA